MTSKSESVSLDKVHSAQELFEHYSISQLSAIKFQLSKDVYNKKSELRSLVGNKYRDLLKVADNIIDMGQLAVEQNNDLVDLTFSKSRYISNNSGTASLDSNHRKFQASILKDKLARLEKSNNPIILRNLVHDLKKSILELSQALANITADVTIDSALTPTSINQSNGQSQIQLSEDSTFDTISSHFLTISKKFYLIKDLFELNSTTEYLIESKKLTQLETEFIKLVKTQLLELTVDNEFDFLLNLMLSYIIVTGSSLLEAFEFFLSTRFEYLVQNSKDNYNYTTDTLFQDNLNYIFNTLNYTEIFKNKLSTMLIKLFYSTNATSNWLSSLPIFRKWERWLNLNKYQLNFSTFINDIKNSLNSKQVEKEIGSWKLKIGNLFLGYFDLTIQNIGNINELTGLINKFLNSFKKFTSLIDLTYGDSSEKLLISVLHKWESKFNELIEKDLTIINETAIDISNYLNQTNTPQQKLDGDDLLFKYNENIDDYIFKITNNKYINNSISETLQKIENCNDLLQSFANSLNSLNKLSTQLTKPILSIDDYEDDDFWKEFSKDLNNKISKISEYKLDLIRKYLTQFFDTSNSTVETLESKKLNSLNIDNLVKFLRILIELTFRVSANNEKNESFKATIESFQINENLSSLITKILNLIVKELSSETLLEIREVLASRYILDEDSQSDIEGQYPEIQVWESYGTENLKVPNSLSIDLQLILFKLCKTLIHGQSGTDTITNDYSDIYLLNEFNAVKQNFIDLLLSEIISSLDKCEIKIVSAEPVAEEEESPEKQESDSKEGEDEQAVATKLTTKPMEIPTLFTYSDIVTLVLLKTSITEPVNDIDASTLKDPLLQKSISKLSEINEDLKSQQYRSAINRTIFENFKSSTLMYNPLFN